jgi:hypothetical protein
MSAINGSYFSVRASVLPDEGPVYTGERLTTLMEPVVILRVARFGELTGSGAVASAA